MGEEGLVSKLVCEKGKEGARERREQENGPVGRARGGRGDGWDGIGVKWVQLMGMGGGGGVWGRGYTRGRDDRG